MRALPGSSRPPPDAESILLACDIRDFCDMALSTMILNNIHVADRLRHCCHIWSFCTYSVKIPSLPYQKSIAHNGCKFAVQRKAAENGQCRKIAATRLLNET
jgi:hypothetical protein